MRTWRDVARYQLLVPWLFLVMPWLVLAGSFVVNFQVFARHVAGASKDDTGGLAALVIFFFVIGIISIGRLLPFGLALGATRRSFYTGTALLGVAISGVDGLGLAGLQAIERATGGWGVRMRFFQLPRILDGPWYLTWLTSFVALAFLFVYGMWFGIVFRRWSVLGVLAFIGAQAIVVLAAALIVSWAGAWSGVGAFFTDLTAAGLTGLLAGLVALLLAGGHATIRGVTV